jgi:plasmid stability protein
MPALLIRDLPDELHRKLKERAAANHRSISSELLVLLEEALHESAGPPPLAAVDRMRVIGTKPLTQDLLNRARREGRP